MNTTTKSFIIGRRYFVNNGKDVYFAMSDRYTASGYRYIRFRSDLHGHTCEYKIRVKDGVEFVDIYGGAVKCITIHDNSVISARNETDYIALNEKEQQFLNGEEVYVSFDELKRWIDKLPLNSSMGFKLQRDPHEVVKTDAERYL